ncbi:hypothetical protein GQ53DRAFT_89986 [Thozetella sp. PMI_491]|nr:hypothetical protein GQ53DRAFT_89986 [Thozetella sp. PMI_491]
MGLDFYVKVVFTGISGTSQPQDRRFIWLSLNQCMLLFPGRVIRSGRPETHPSFTTPCTLTAEEESITAIRTALMARYPQFDGLGLTLSHGLEPIVHSRRRMCQHAFSS